MATDARSPRAITDDAFLGGRLRMLQPAKGYRAGLDAVMLAAAVPAQPGQSLIDVGSGVGTVGLAVARRVESVRVVLVERSPELADLARKNVIGNELGEHVRVIETDIARPLQQAPNLAALAGTFDHVVANPPYMPDGAGTLSADPIRAGANAMGPEGLEAWARFMAAMAAPAGRLSLIHRADALPAILDAFGRRFGGLSVFPLYPRPEAAAHRIIVTGIKDSRAPLVLRPGLVLHEVGGAFTPRAEAVLRHGAALV